VKGLLALRRWIANNDFDVINTHSSSDSWMVAVGMRLAFKKKPLVRTRHVSAPVSNNRSTQWLYKTASDHIVTTGEKLKQTLIRDNGINAEKITSVPTGIDCQQFLPNDDKHSVRTTLKLPTDTLIIGILATLCSWKGHAYLLDVFQQLQQNEHLPNIHLLIVGNGPQWDNLQQQSQDLGISNDVTMCGDQADVTPWLQAMDIFALPSYANEGVPQSIMPAMACQLLVVSTTVGSITEIINDDTGIIIEPNNTEQLKEALLTLITDTEKRRTLGEQAHHFANSHCGLTQMTEKMDHIFSEIIEKTHAK